MTEEIEIVAPSRLKKLGDWVRHYAIALLVLFVISGFAITAQVIITNEESDDAQAAAEGIERRAQICDAFKRGQQTDRILIDTVLQDTGAGTPLLDVPAFEDLPSTVQTYLRELATASVPDPDDPPPLAERLATFRDENLGRDDLPEFCL